MTYREALAWLYSTQLTGIKLGLEGIRRLIDALGGQPPGVRFVHVAGTNGKGSVCAMVDAVSRAGGWRTGLYTSPHLLGFCERIQVNGELIREESVGEGLTRLRDLTAAWESPPTYFEITTALALDWFQQCNVEVVAWETGLGGRLDATNAVRPAVSVITAIGLDHQAYLGETIEAVAGEKAGIIKPGVPVVMAPQPEPAAAAVIRRAAAERKAELRIVENSVDATWPVALAGSHQRVNAAVALAALEAGRIAVNEAAQRRALAEVRHPGRFQRVGNVVLDGAHNPAAAERLAVTWAEEFPGGERPTIILGVLADKDAAGICQALAKFAGRFIVAPVRSPRGGSANGLQALLPGAVPATDFPSALAQAQRAEAPILVTGSLFLVGEALAYLTGQEAPELSWQ